jgi:hypothetical protein
MDLPKSFTRETPPEGVPILWIWAAAKHITAGDLYEGSPRDAKTNEKILGKQPSHWLPWPIWWPKKEEIRVDNTDPLGLGADQPVPEEETRGIIWEAESPSGQAFRFTKGQSVMIEYTDETETSLTKDDKSYSGGAVFLRHVSNPRISKDPLVEVQTLEGTKRLFPIACIQNLARTSELFKENDRVLVNWKDHNASPGSWEDSSYYGPARYVRLLQEGDSDSHLLDREPYAIVKTYENDPGSLFPLSCLLPVSGPDIQIEVLEGNCPVIGRGTIDKIPFYFETKGASWGLGLGGDPEEKPEYYYDGKYNDAGWMSRDDARSLIEETARKHSDLFQQKSPL